MDEWLFVVIDRVPCAKHSGPDKSPCWWIHASNGKKLPAVCGRRATKAGFVGRISPGSLTRRRPTKVS